MEAKELTHIESIAEAATYSLELVSSRVSPSRVAAVVAVSAVSVSLVSSRVTGSCTPPAVLVVSSAVLCGR